MLPFIMAAAITPVSNYITPHVGVVAQTSLAQMVCTNQEGYVGILTSWISNGWASVSAPPECSRNPRLASRIPGAFWGKSATMARDAAQSIGAR